MMTHGELQQLARELGFDSVSAMIARQEGPLKADLIRARAIAGLPSISPGGFFECKPCGTLYRTMESWMAHRRQHAAPHVDDGFYLCEIDDELVPCEVADMWLYPLVRLRQNVTPIAAFVARHGGTMGSISLHDGYTGTMLGPLRRPGASRVPDPAPNWPRAPAGTRCTHCGELCDGPEQAFMHGIGSSAGWQHYACSGLGGYMDAERAAGNMASSPVPKAEADRPLYAGLTRTDEPARKPVPFTQEYDKPFEARMVHSESNGRVVVTACEADEDSSG